MAALVLRDLSTARQYFINGVRTACRRHCSWKSSNLPKDGGRCVAVSRENARTLCTSRRRELRRSSVLNTDASQHNPDAAGPESNSASSSSDSDYDKEISDKILQAALPFVHQHGWSNEAISQGAETLGYAGVVHGMFPRGGYDLIHYFYLSCNDHLVEYLKKIAEDPESAQKIPTLEKVEDAVKRRLEMVIPYLSRWPEAMAMSTLPNNIPTTLAALLTMADDVCHYCGDKSVDFNWYSRRVGLASIYKASELYLIQDKSPDHENTWRFLKQRLQEGRQIDRIIAAGAGEASNFAVEALSATFSTARNILRLNR